MIARGQHDQALRPGQHLLGIDAFLSVAGQPLHLAVAPVLQPRLEFGAVVGGVCAGEVAGIEAQFGGTLADGVLHREPWRIWWNWWTTCWATSRTERISTLISTSAWR